MCTVGFSDFDIFFKAHHRCPRNKQQNFSVGTETNRNKICFGFVSVCFVKPKTKKFSLFQFVSVFRTYIKTTETNRTVSKQTKTNQNNPKFWEKYKKMLSIKLIRLVFCLFWFNQNIETLCFGIEPKQPKQTVSKQTKTNPNKPDNPKFCEKYQNMLSITLFLLLFCLFRFNRNTESLCFGMEPKQPK